MVQFLPGGGGHAVQPEATLVTGQGCVLASDVTRCALTQCRGAHTPHTGAHRALAYVLLEPCWLYGHFSANALWAVSALPWPPA